MPFQDFLQSTRKHYSAELEAVNFATEFEVARLNINNWVETRTQGGLSRCRAGGPVLLFLLSLLLLLLLLVETPLFTCSLYVPLVFSGKIQELLLPGILNPTTKLVLVNAIYFKGNWDKKFQESATHEVDFRVNKVPLLLGECAPGMNLKKCIKFGPLCHILPLAVARQSKPLPSHGLD